MGTGNGEYQHQGAVTPRGVRRRGGRPTLPSPERSGTTDCAPGPPRRDRLRHPDRLLRLRARHRLGPPPLGPQQRRLLPLRPRHPGLDRRAGLPLGQPRRPGGDRDGRLRRQVRHPDEPLLLGGRHSGDGVRRRLHDAVLLRLPRALGARVPPAPLRREDPRSECHHLRADDGALVRHLDVRPRQAARAGARLELPLQRGGLRHHRAGLHLPGRPHVGDLQRGAAVLPHRAGLPAAGAHRAQGHRRLGRPDRGARAGGDGRRLPGGRLDPQLAVSRLRRTEPDGRRVVRDGDGPRLRPLLRLLVHRLPGGAAGHGGRIDERRAADPAARRAAQDALPRPRHSAGDDRDRPAPRPRRPAAASAPTARRTTTSRSRRCWPTICRPACSASGSPH